MSSPYSPAETVPNECMMIVMSMYTQLFVSRMDPVVDAAPETLLFRGATLGIMNLWNQSFGSTPNENTSYTNGHTNT